MNYRLEDISENDFERLVNMICHKILGCGVIEFSKGKDGNPKLQQTLKRMMIIEIHIVLENHYLLI